MSNKEIQFLAFNLIRNENIIVIFVIFFFFKFDQEKKNEKYPVTKRIKKSSQINLAKHTKIVKFHSPSTAMKETSMNMIQRKK